MNKKSSKKSAESPSSDGVSGDFLTVDAEKFRHTLRDINFDVYLKLSDDNFAHVFSRSSGLDYNRLAQYMKKGVKRLYIKKSDQKKYEDFISQGADGLLRDPNVSKEKKIATLLNMTEQNMSEVFTRFNVEESTAESTKKVVNNYVDLMTDSPKTLSILLNLAAHGDYLYYHAISSAIFSVFLARASGQFNRRTLEILGLGAFLHDIGVTQLPPEITESANDLSPAQWQQVRSHPKIGLRMLEKTHNIPDEVRYIVYQHHEEPSGNGYPNGLRGSAIYLPAKIVSVADAFSSLLSDRPYRRAFNVEQAVQLMKSDVGKYELQLVDLLFNTFSSSDESSSAA